MTGRTIAVLGAGRVGRTLAAAWARSGWEVLLGSREPGSARLHEVVAHIAAEGKGDGSPSRLVRAARHAEAAQAAEVVVVAVPGQQVPDLVAGLGDALGGRLVVDTTNNLAAGRGRLDALDLLRAAGAVPVRAFSCVGWERMREPVVGGERCDLPYTAPTTDRDAVERLVTDVGFRPVWFGEGDQAVAAVEHVTRTWLHLVMRNGHDRRLGLRLLIPEAAGAAGAEDS